MKKLEISLEDKGPRELNERIGLKPYLKLIGKRIKLLKWSDFTRKILSIRVNLKKNREINKNLHFYQISELSSLLLNFCDTLPSFLESKILTLYKILNETHIMYALYTS